MRLPPQPRYRLYGSRANYRRIAAALLTGRVRRPPDDVAALERGIMARTGAAHALCLPQGRVGLYLALRALIRPGQKVVLAPYTIYDVVNMVVAAGGRPMFADIDPVTCNIDPAEVARRIDDETGAVVATHLQGLVCDVERIAALCRARGVALIEDAAQCFGGRVAGRHVGTFGQVGVFSFSRAKNVNTIYGGVAITDDAALDSRMRAALDGLPYEDTGRLFERAANCLVGDILAAPVVFQLATYWLFRYDCLTGRGLVDRLVGAESRPALRTALPEGYLRRMTPLQARLAFGQLDRVDGDAAARLELARIYRDGLGDLCEVQLPPWHEDGRHIYPVFPIQVAERDALVRDMMRRGRDVRAQYYRSLADEPCFAAFRADCPQTRAVAARVVLLPTYPGYRAAEARRNVEAIRAFYGRTATARSGSPPHVAEPVNAPCPGSS